MLNDRRIQFISTFFIVYYKVIAFLLNIVMVVLFQVLLQKTIKIFYFLIDQSNLNKEQIIFPIVNLENSMDAQITIVTEQDQKGVYVAQFKAQDLAIFSYYIESNKECYLIDPTFDNTVYKNFIQKRTATLKFVVLTHYHADFLSAHGNFNVPVIMGENSKRQLNQFQLQEMKDNTKFKVGNVETKVIATPGHTTQSTSYVLSNQDGNEFCIFTGDTVFLKQVGRPDLAVAAHISSSDLAGMLYESVQKIKALDKNLRLYPGHGSGSACGKSIGAGNFCTLGVQHQSNYGFLIKDKSQFIQKLTHGLQAPPSYFFYDAKINQQGKNESYQKILAKCKKPIQAQQFKKLIDKKVQVIDTRKEITNGLIEGSYWLNAKGDLSGWIAMIFKPQQQFMIVTQLGKQEEIIERFLRIGFFNILGYNNFNAQSWSLGKLEKLQLKTYEQLEKDRKYIHLDVRNLHEWQELGVFQSTLLISLPQISTKIGEIKKYVAQNTDSTLIVNCKTGMRARFAASILLKNGIPTLVLNQNLQKLKQKGVKLVQYKVQASADGGCCQIY